MTNSAPHQKIAVHPIRLYFTRNIIAAIILIALIISLFNYYKDTTYTDGITVSADGHRLQCASSINILNTKSIDEYLQDIDFDDRGQLQNILCNFDSAYNSSDLDRALLFSFIQKQVEQGGAKRPDIAGYFYRRIINANPDDALSILISKKKMTFIHP